jgi:hypothetical protein
MKSATVLRTFFLSLLVTGLSIGQAPAQGRTTAPTTTKDGSTTQAPQPQPSGPAPVYRPAPNDRTQTPVPAPAPTTQQKPAPVYRPAPGQTTTQAPAPQQQTTIDRNYDVNGDGVISKEEKKRMKEIRKAEKKRARELRKAQHEEWVDEHKREQAAQGLEQRQHELKAHGKANGKGHGKGKNK